MTAERSAMSEEQKKRNKNNRKRGSHFEKVGADFLDMDVVPYSGSNARFGYGDVRDSMWLGEFKNITAKDNRCRILTNWFKDNKAKSKLYGLMPFLAWMPSGRTEKYVMLEQTEFDRLGVGHDISIEIQKKSVKAVNVFIDINDDWIKPIKAKKKIAQIKFGDDVYYMMEMTLFKNIIVANGLKGVRQGYGKAY